MTKGGSIFRNNLFDFDFEAEAAAKKFHDETVEAIHFEELTERVNALREMSRRAFDENRMGAYFRIQDCLDSYASEAAKPVLAPTPTIPISTAKAAPKASAKKAPKYVIPQVRLSYVGDSGVKPKVISSADCSKIFRETYLPGEIEFQEDFKVLYLNQANEVLGVHTVSKGGIASTIVDSRIVFTGALLAHAVAIVCCHNHPSGNTKPSTQDDNLTRNLAAGAKTLDIRFLDHIIITSNGYYSYNDEGKL